MITDCLRFIILIGILGTLAGSTVAIAQVGDAYEERTNKDKIQEADKERDKEILLREWISEWEGRGTMIGKVAEMLSQM